MAPGLAKVPMKRAAATVVPIEGDTPPDGVSIGCVPSAQGPQLVLALSDGTTAMAAFLTDAQLFGFTDALMGAANRAQTMSAPKPEPEVRRDV